MEKEIIMNAHRSTTREVADDVEISNGSWMNVIGKEICCKIVEQKQERTEVAQETLNVNNYRMSRLTSWVSKILSLEN